MKRPQINILLSTYNGEKYIVEQLDSIFSQTYKNFVLYIRDDGSTDSTVDLINQYKNSHKESEKQICFLSDGKSENIGYMKSFWYLLDNCGCADYYAFCDQDDVWLANKLQMGVNQLINENEKEPLLYFSSFYQCNEDLSMKSPMHNMLQTYKLRNMLFYTPAFGFTIMFNEQLRRLALKTEDRTDLPHDGWLQKLAAAFGKIIFDHECTAYYRRHNLAVTVANKNILTLIKNWVVNDIFGDSMKKTHYVLHRFYEEYGKSLNEDDASFLELYATEKITFKIWLERIKQANNLRPSKAGNIALRVCFLLNAY